MPPLLPLLLAALLSLLAPAALAQVTNVTDQTSPPIPGVGHNYTGTVNETVNPQNGSLSINIQLSLPPARKLTIPFAAGYNGGNGPCLQPAGNGGLAGCSGSSTFSYDGWSYVVPQLSRTTATYNPGKMYSDQSTVCSTSTAYIFTDASGSPHSFNLNNIYDYWVTQRQNESLACQNSHMQNSLTGGDWIYNAALVGATSANYANTDPGNYEGVPTVASADGTVFTFPYWDSTCSPGDPFVSSTPSSITDRNGNSLTISFGSGCSSLTVEDTIGRTAVSAQWVSTPLNAPTTANVTVAGLSQPYKMNWAEVSWSGWSYSSTTVINAPPADDCASASGRGAGGNQYDITSLTLPNGQNYEFSYDPAYGVVDKITYPTGGYVSYTWGLNSMGGVVNYIDTHNYQCAARLDTTAITKRIVSFDGSTQALEQDFSYSTQWDATYPEDWDSKTTTITTKDLVRGTSYQTKYTYSPMAIPPANDTHAQGNYVPVEATIQYYDTNGTLLKTVQKGWSGPFLLDCELTQVGAAGPISGTFYVYGSAGVVTDQRDYDYGQITSLSVCANAATPPSGITAARETLTTYQSGFPTPTGFAGPVILDRPCQVITKDNTGTTVAENEYYYDGGSVLCGGSPTAGNATKIVKRCLQSGAACSAGDAIATDTYDSHGQLTSTTDGRSNETQYSYADSYSACEGNAPPVSPSDAFLTQVTYPQTNGISHIVSYCYDYTTGLLRSSTDENNQTTDYQYNDSLNRLTKTIFPDTGITQISYDDAPPNPTVTTSMLIGSGVYLTTVTTTDGMGQQIKSLLATDPDCSTGDRTDTTYDGLGRVYTASNPYCSTSDPTYGITTYTYDALGRARQVTNPDNSVVTTSYGGRATAVTDESGKQRVSQFDGLGRLTSVCEVTSTTLSVGISGSTTPASCGLDISGTGFLTSYGYDGLDDLISVAQSPLNPRSFTYNSLGQLITANNPESGQTSYTYDADGNLATKTDGRGTTITYAYDPDNRLTGKTYSDSTPAATYNYDQSSAEGVNLTHTIGRLSSEATAGTYNTESIFSYDPMGRIVNNSDYLGCCSFGYVPMAYTYDLAGNIITKPPIAGHGTVTNTYNTASRLTGATNTVTPTTLIIGAHYNALGEITSETLGNGLTETWTYDHRGRIDSYALTNGSTTQYSYSLSYYANGNVMTANDSVNGNWTYSYDDFNRLAASTGTNASYTYAYDRFGNRWQQNLTSGSGQESSLAFDANNHIVGLGYDAAGNLTSDGTNTYVYNAENQIASVPSQNATEYYDAEGRRSIIVALNQWFPYYDRVYDLDGHLLARCNPTYGCENTEYWVGNRHLMNYSELPLFNHQDWLGTLRYESETDGSQYGYCLNLPFGENTYCPEKDGDLTQIHFAGKEQDYGNTEIPDDLDNFGARFYLSYAGRFMSPDPDNAGADASNPQSWNMFSYAVNNPVTFTDPTGRECVWDNGSFDSENDKQTGSVGGCQNAGGTWIELGQNGNSSDEANSGLQNLVSDIQNGNVTVTVTTANGDQYTTDYNASGQAIQTITPTTGSTIYGYGSTASGPSYAGLGLAAVGGEGTCVIAEPCGGIAGTAVTGLVVATVATVVGTDLYHHFAKGGDTNVADTGIMDEVYRMIRSGRAKTICEALQILYNSSSGTRREKIKATQKAKGCRGH